METKPVKKILFAVALSIVLLVAGFLGYRSYAGWRQERLIRETRDYLAQSDYRNAYLCLQGALRYNSADVEACRLMAELYEAAALPNEALFWRSRVAELNPGLLDDELCLAQAAMRTQDFATATNALAAVNPAGKQTAAYHDMAGAMAAALNQSAQAEAHFLEEARLEPTNQIPLLNIAVLRLRGGKEEELADARSSLQRMASNSTNSILRCMALRELTADAMRYRQTNDALALSGELLRQTNSVFHDRLLRLDVLLDTGSAEFKPALSDIRREAASDPAHITELVSWQMFKNQPKDALVWLHSLPSNMTTNQSVAMSGAECYAVTGDWRGLQSQVEGQNWGDMDFVRHAFHALALRKQDLAEGSRTQWALAMNAAQSQKLKLNTLLRLALQWNWAGESEQALTAIVKLSPGDNGAFQALVHALFVGGHTRELMQLYHDKAAHEPSNLAAKNNLAWTALLLSAQEMRPDLLARDNYQEAPTNSSFASTYAFSLLMQKKNAEALRVLQSLDPRDLENPSIASCYGLALIANGDQTKGKKYLELGYQSPMLPEQRDLMNAAKRGDPLFKP
jgi:predicted Zn-dependent protease